MTTKKKALSSRSSAPTKQGDPFDGVEVPYAEDEHELDEHPLVRVLSEKGWKAVQKQIEADPKMLKDPRIGDVVGSAIAGLRDRATDFVSFLLDRGLNPNAMCHGQPLIEWATEQAGTPKIVRLLLERGAEVTRLKNGGRDLLLSAIYVRLKKEVIDDLIRFGAKKDLIVELHVDGPKMLLDKLKANPLLLQELDDPIELLNRGIKSEELVEFLLDHGVNPNEHGPTRDAPLRSAVGEVNINVVRLLLDHGADPNPNDAQAHVPIIYGGFIGDARAERMKAIVGLLIAKGAKTLDPAWHDDWMTKLEAAAARYAKNRGRK